jgi:hypothetical protein
MSSSKLNFITSFAFIISALYSYIRGNNYIYHGSIMCLITSLFYHGSLTYKVDDALSEAFRIVDILTTQFCILFYIVESIGFNIWSYISVGCLSYMILLYYIYSGSQHPEYGYYLHSTLHIVSNIGIITIVESHLS